MIQSSFANAQLDIFKCNNFESFHKNQTLSNMNNSGPKHQIVTEMLISNELYDPRIIITRDFQRAWLRYQNAERRFDLFMSNFGSKGFYKKELQIAEDEFAIFEDARLDFKMHFDHYKNQLDQFTKQL